MSFRPGARQFFERRGAPTPPLPYDAEVEYLESTGKQYIDTGIYGGVDLLYKARFAFTANQSLSRAAGLFGNNRTDGTTRIFTYVSNLRIGKWSFAAFTSSYHSTTGTDTLWHTAEIDTTNLSQSAVFDGVEVNNWQFDSVATPTQGVSRYTICVFTARPDLGLASAKFSRFSITKKSTSEILIDLIPVRFTNELGESEGAMYDRVSGALFRNQGTGAFTIGPDVATPVMGLHFMPKPPPYDAEVDYLESTGTQYIDTGLWFTEDTQLECVMSEGSDLSSLSTGGGGAVTGSTINGYGQQWRYAGYNKNVNGNFYWDRGVLCDGSFITCTMDSSRKVYRNGSYLFDACPEGYHDVESRYTRMYIMASLTGSTIDPKLYRVKSFKIVRSGTTIIDAKAVRFTNELGVSEGAMYDNVSKQLFRNAGTGAFLWAEKQ